MPSAPAQSSVSSCSSSRDAFSSDVAALFSGLAAAKAPSFLNLGEPPVAGSDQTVNRDKKDVIGLLLASETALDALLVQDDGSSARSSAAYPDTLERLTRYRRIVNQVHPERCPDNRASDAFERISCAYDMTCAAAVGSVIEMKSSNWWCTKSSRSVQGQWWHAAGGVHALDRLLQYCDVAARAVRRELHSGRFGMGGQRKEEQLLQDLRARVVDMERVCEHLDRTAGLPRTRLWPGGASASPTSPPSDEARLISRFVDLLPHLRGVHRFCPLSSQRCSHPAELEVASPQAKLEELMQRWLGESAQTNYISAAPASATVAAPASLSAQAVDDDIDPLDAYMASLEGELLGGGEEAVAPSQAVTSAATDRKSPSEPPKKEPMSTVMEKLAVVSDLQKDGLVEDTSLSAPVAPRSLMPRSKPDPAGMRLATGTLVSLPAQSNEATAVQSNSAADVTGFQNLLFTDFDSGDESELEDK